MALTWETKRGQLTCLSAPALGEKTRRGGGQRVRVSRALPGFGAFAGLAGQWRGTHGGSIEMDLGDCKETVEIDPEMGPKIMDVDGSFHWMSETATGKSWSARDASDQKVLAFRAARMNVELRRKLPELRRQAEERAQAEAAAAAKRRQEALRQDLQSKLLAGVSADIIQARCALELAREALPWAPIGMDLVISNHKRQAPGMLYGLEFPWSADLLVSMGPRWLTRAFQAAGTLAKNNSVTSISIGRKIDAGNNAGKFLFEVAYARQTPDLDTLLFAKVPYEMTRETQSDRISSSVYKQPMDVIEINTYRLLEGSFPCQTPKFYYGDISNETSNFILITQRIPYTELDGPGRECLAPGAIEGPYDKCKDFQLRGSGKDYYMQLIHKAAMIAAHHKSGRLCPLEVLSQSLVPPRPLSPELWGMSPSAPTGGDPKKLTSVFKGALRFITDTAAALFPAYVLEESFKEKWFRTMMTWSAYSAEIQFWLHCDQDYVSLGHTNLNQDNAYFWRDESGKLDCGLIDWGGFGHGNLGHKMWWTFNCADFSNFGPSLREYIDAFVTRYAEHGGPMLDAALFERHVLITSLGNMSFMAAAVPNCFKMCAAEEWKSIKDRHDPRIAANVDGKSTLRTTVHVMGVAVRALQELHSDKVLEEFIRDVYVGAWGQTAKSGQVIFGA